MDGDLSLSQSLGGLRIANPDRSSPSTIKDTPPNATSTRSPVSPLSPTSSNSAQNPVFGQTPLDSSPQLLLFETGDESRSCSQLDFNPDAFSTESITIDKSIPPPEQQNVPNAKPPTSYQQRMANRQSIPLNYQEQQQAQFPQYPTMMPQAVRHTSSGARPMSMGFSQNPAGSSSMGPIPARDASYRMHKDSSRSSGSNGPRRNNSRGGNAALQAGVPSREGSHSDRSYRHNDTNTGNGPLPPRRSSRGMASNNRASSTGQGVNQLSGSLYGLEGGPLSSSEEWQDRGAAVGVKQEIDANGRPVSKYVKKGVKDFNFGRTLGEGSYSTVLAATDRQTLKEYAIKVLDKRHIIKEKKVKYVNIEKDTLNRLTDHPGVVRLYYTFQDERSLYFVLDLATGGELLGTLKKMTTFNEDCTRFYGAQILDTVEYIHSRGIIHRDLKPENVLLDDKMHVKITDFGTAKILDVPKRGGHGLDAALPGNPLDGSEDNRANSFVGTAEYVSPELLTDKNACKASDLWAFGCIIYQLLAGRPPFKAGNEYQTFQKIVALDYTFPQGFPLAAKDLVERLLVLDPSRRLSIDHIKNHEFFDGVKWGQGLWRQKAPPLQSYPLASAATIKLNGSNAFNSNGGSFPPDIAPSHSTKAAHIPGDSRATGAPRPSPRVITELPPPSQLDIEWSPVLTRRNERILKLGNLLVLSTPGVVSPNTKNGLHSSDTDQPSKLSRLFGGGTTKKRQRLVMVTSSARIIMAAAGGDEKKTKIEISLSARGCTYQKSQDAKGLSYWSIDTVGIFYNYVNWLAY